MQIQHWDLGYRNLLYATAYSSAIDRIRLPIIDGLFLATVIIESRSIHTIFTCIQLEHTDPKLQRL